MLSKWLLPFLLIILSPNIAIAGESTDSKYEGIEIKVNVNQASAQELADLLKGIGLKKAQAIVEYREAHGRFESADALVAVKGIGPSIVEKNRARIEL